MKYSLRFIILVIEMDVSRHVLVLDTSISTTSIMDRREYYFVTTPRVVHKSGSIDRRFVLSRDLV